MVDLGARAAPARRRPEKRQRLDMAEADRQPAAWTAREMATQRAAGLLAGGGPIIRRESGGRPAGGVAADQRTLPGRADAR